MTWLPVLLLLGIALPQNLGHVPDHERPGDEDGFFRDPEDEGPWDPDMDMDPEDMYPEDMDPEDMYQGMDPEMRSMGRRNANRWYSMFSSFCRRMGRFPMGFEEDEEEGMEEERKQEKSEEEEGGNDEDERGFGSRKDVAMQLREECSFRRQDPRGLWPTFELMRLVFSNPELSDRFEMMAERYRYRDY